MSYSEQDGQVPEGIDLRIEPEESEMGIRKLTITAFTLQAEIDLATELPRIKKLLERDWAVEDEQ